MEKKSKVKVKVKSKVKDKALAEVPKDNDISLSNFNADIFEKALKDEEAKHKLLQKYISDQLIEGVDYGKIKIKGTDGKEYLSKDTLFKSGSEKFTNLLKLKSIFFPDNETRLMLPQSVIDAGVITYKCRLIHIHKLEQFFTKDELKKMIKEKDKSFEDIVRIFQVSEGRGACTLAEKKGQVNNAIKITEKRAQTDAVLRIGLSDTFTQDIEDMQNDEPTKKEPPKPDDIISFGKHKGKKWNEAPVDYLQWLKGEGKFEFPDALQIIIDSKSPKKEEPKKVEVMPAVKPTLPSPIKSTDICKLGNYKDVPLKYNKVPLNHLLAFQTQAANPEALSTVIHETIDKRVTEYKEKLGYKDADLKAMIKLDIKKDVEYIDLDQAEKLIVFRNLKNIIAKLGERNEK